MDSMKEYIEEAISVTGYKIEPMSLLESVMIRKNVLIKYSDGNEHHTLWEHTNMENSFYIREQGSWKWLDEFLNLDECILFFDYEDDPIFYILPANQSIRSFISELSFTEFYITNKNLDFLISFNDSDYLTAHGTAEPWLRSKVKELSKTGCVDMDGKSYL